MDMGQYKRRYCNGDIIFLQGVVGPPMLEEFPQQIRGQSAKVGTKSGMSHGCVLQLTTCGGDFQSAMSIYNELWAMQQASEGLYIVEAVASVQICLAGLLILMAVPKERRAAFPRTFFYHNPGAAGQIDLWTIRKPELSFARLDDRQKTEAMLNYDYVRLAREVAIVDAIVKGTNMTREQVFDAIRGGFYWNCRDAVDYGVIANNPND